MIRSSVWLRHVSRCVYQLTHTPSRPQAPVLCNVQKIRPPKIVVSHYHIRTYEAIFLYFSWFRLDFRCQIDDNTHIRNNNTNKGKTMDLIDRLQDVSEIEDIDHDICDIAREAAREIAELRQVIIRIKAEAQVAYEWASQLADYQPINPF